MSDRRQDAYAVRLEAAELARSRDLETHKANGDEQHYAGAKYFMSFTKGLPHNPETGLLEDPRDFGEFRRAIDDGFIDPFTDRVRHGAKFEVTGAGSGYQVSAVACPADNFRQWEAPTAGLVFELEGPDAQAVTMPPAPALLNSSGHANPELVLEMAEVYELAILRDQPFREFESGMTNSHITGSIGRLNSLDAMGDQREQRPRKVNGDGDLDRQTVFRGSSPGVEVGPYLSQFLLLGNEGNGNSGSAAEGLITYGTLQVDQKVPIATPGADYMVTMPTYVAVQRGLRPAGETYVPGSASPAGTPRPARRFIKTPRDLATYVHYDALYEAYLNAGLILLGMEAPFDPAFDQLSGGGAGSNNGVTRRNASGFALYGGPHILTLVTEVATRALKAVRFQKFNNHLRLRPEALAARIELERLRSTGSLSTAAAQSIPAALTADIAGFSQALINNGTLGAISSGPGAGTHFLPMAFPEGSPMHPAYGAGHATVAGACVTILKAFFDTSSILVKRPNHSAVFKRWEAGDRPIAYRAPVNDSADLLDDSIPPVPSNPEQFLTLEGELNKLAANISIGRDMAGVHFFSDYYDSLRMGEEIALGILEEQALTYSTDPFVLSVPTFDGDVVRMGRR